MGEVGGLRAHISESDIGGGERKVGSWWGGEFLAWVYFWRRHRFARGGARTLTLRGEIGGGGFVGGGGGVGCSTGKKTASEESSFPGERLNLGLPGKYEGHQGKRKGGSFL